MITVRRNPVLTCWLWPPNDADLALARTMETRMKHQYNPAAVYTFQDLSTPIIARVEVRAAAPAFKVGPAVTVTVKYPPIVTNWEHGPNPLTLDVLARDDEQLRQMGKKRRYVTTDSFRRRYLMGAWILTRRQLR